MASDRREFFERLIELGKPKRRDIVEKDYHLQRLLFEFSKDDWLKENLLFKGGTCLIKAYLEHHRFSEDLDFTWRDQSFWERGSKSQGQKHCSQMVSELIDKVRGISGPLGLMFKGDKKNPQEVHIHTGGRMVALKLSYMSDVLKVPGSIKIEVGFQERVLYPPRMMALKCYAERFGTKELRLLYPDHLEGYFEVVKFPCYDLKEIFTEKCRAAMTRVPFKLRDLIDIYYIEDKFGLSVEDYKDEIKKKTVFSLDMFGQFIGDISNPVIIREEDLNGEDIALLVSDPPKGLLGGLQRINDKLMTLKHEVLEERKR